MSAVGILTVRTNTEGHWNRVSGAPQFMQTRRTWNASARGNMPLKCLRLGRDAPRQPVWYANVWRCGRGHSPSPPPLLRRHAPLINWHGSDWVVIIVPQRTSVRRRLGRSESEPEPLVSKGSSSELSYPSRCEEDREENIRR